jgi:ubiquinol-cytochrome c reductase cytochrome b subunit
MPPTPDPGATGLWPTIRRLLYYPLPEKVGWWHSIGGLLAMLFAVQLLTGILLALYYSPSAAEAWESVRFIESEVRAGSLIRGVHHWASTAFVVLLCCHLARTFLWAAYKGKRRWVWVTGAMLFGCVIGFGFTGYLLPWDLKAYFGTRVGVEIAGSAPLVGESLKQLLQGGSQVGALTLPRFYALHAIILPLVTTLLIGAHLALIRKHGITPVGRRVDYAEPVPDGSVTYFPHHLAKEAFLGILLLLALAGLAVYYAPGLEGRADPQNTEYVPRPEWYFLGLQQLLRLFQGPLEIVGTVIIPTALAAVVFVLPWLDRNPERRLRRRPIALILGGGLALSAVVLTVWGHFELKDEEFRMARSKKPETSRPEPTKQPITDSTSIARGRKLYEQLDCAACHESAAAGRGLNIPPSLAFEGSRVEPAWLRRYLRSPTRMRFAEDGVRSVSRMPDYQLDDDEASALAAYLGSLRDSSIIPDSGLDWRKAPTAAEIREGEQLVSQYQCKGCHKIGGDGAEVGPHLDRVGSRLRPDYIYALIRDPKKVVPETAMKNSGLWDEEARAIVQFLRSLR